MTPCPRTNAIYSAWLTGLDVGYACLQLRRRLDGLNNAALARAKRDFILALADDYAGSARSETPRCVRPAGEALIAAARDESSLDPRRRALCPQTQCPRP